jgi:phosphorylase kinase alpha/beta subunit
MTAGELKFALEVEAVLNKIPQPEFRQLMVEAIMILCLIVANDNGHCQWHETIVVDTLVHHANEIFIKEQRDLDGDVTLCCGSTTGRPSWPLKCAGAAGICQNFYDSAPSGRYGTMSYMCRSVVQCLHMPTAPDGNLDCTVQ